LKKEAKTFVHLAYALGQHLCTIDKSFLVLFLKKRTASLLLLAASLGAIGQARQSQGNPV
jgi:hypothetical protein